MSFSDRNKLPQELSKYQFIHLDIQGAKKWFPKVGSSFTWFLLQKAPNQKSFTINNNYFIKDTQIAKLDSGVNFIPLYYSNLVRSILAKAINNKAPKYNIQTSSFLHRFTKKQLLQATKDQFYKYKVIHTPSQTFWSKVAHKYQEGYKVFISLSNQYSTFIDNCGMTQSIAFIQCKNLIEAQRIKAELDNLIYKFINNITRYGNFNNIRVLQNLATLQNIKLSAPENLLIKQFNENYYGKEKK